MLKAYYNTDFIGQYPVPVAAVVIADSKLTAARKLKGALAKIHLEQKVSPEKMIKIDLSKSQVIMLSDGEY